MKQDPLQIKDIKMKGTYIICDKRLRASIFRILGKGEEKKKIVTGEKFIDCYIFDNSKVDLPALFEFLNKAGYLYIYQTINYGKKKTKESVQL